MQMKNVRTIKCILKMTSLRRVPGSGVPAMHIKIYDSFGSIHDGGEETKPDLI